MLHFFIYFLLTADYSRESFAEKLSVTNGTTIEGPINRTSQSNPFVKLKSVNTDSVDNDSVPEHNSFDLTDNSSKNANNEPKINAEHQNDDNEPTTPEMLNITSNSLNSNEELTNVSNYHGENKSNSDVTESHFIDLQQQLKMNELLNNTSENGQKTVFVPSKDSSEDVDVDVDLIAHNEPLSGRPDDIGRQWMESYQTNIGEQVSKETRKIDTDLVGESSESQGIGQSFVGKSKGDGSLDVDIDLVPVSGMRPDVKPRIPSLGDKRLSKAAVDVEIDLVDTDSTQKIGSARFNDSDATNLPTGDKSNQERVIYRIPKGQEGKDDMLKVINLSESATNANKDTLHYPMGIDIDLVPQKGDRDSRVQSPKDRSTGQYERGRKVTVDVDLINHQKADTPKKVVDLGSKDPYIEVDIDFLGDKNLHLVNDYDHLKGSRLGKPIGSNGSVNLAIDVDIEFVGDKKLKLGPRVTDEAIVVTEGSISSIPLVTQEASVVTKESPMFRSVTRSKTDGPYIEVDIEFVANNNSLLKTLKTYRGPNGEEMIELPPGFKFQESAVEVDIELVGKNISGKIEPQTIVVDTSKKKSAAAGRAHKLVKSINRTQVFNESHPFRKPKVAVSSKDKESEEFVEVDIDFVTNRKLFNISGLIDGGGGPVIEIPQNVKGVTNAEVEVDIEFIDDKGKIKGSIMSTIRPALHMAVKSEKEVIDNELSDETEVSSDSKNLKEVDIDTEEQPDNESGSGRQINVSAKDKSTDITSGEEITDEERNESVVVYTAKLREPKKGTTRTLNKFPIPPHMKPSLPSGRMKADSAGQDDSKTSSKGGVSIWVWGTIVAVVAMSLMVIAALSYSPIRQKAQEAT